MFNSLTNKVRSFFQPQDASSRKRKRPIYNGDDSDCEIIEVKRIKSADNQQQLGYNFFEKMADWVRNKSSWEKMFDFRKKDSNRTNGQFQEEKDQQQTTNKHNENVTSGLSTTNRFSQGQGQYLNSTGQPYVKGRRRDQGIKERRDRIGEEIRPQADGHTINGSRPDRREIPPDDLFRKPVVSRKSYASAVSGTDKEVMRSQQPPVSAQTNGISEIEVGNSTPRTLFPSKKHYIHFTANETIRLDEKERYKTLLQQYTHVPLKTKKEESFRQDTWPSLERSRPHRLEDSLLGSEARRFVSKIDTSKSKEIPRYKMTPTVSHSPTTASLLQRHISPIDVIKSASFSTGPVQSPTSVQQPPLLESTRFPETSVLCETIVIESQKERFHVISPDREIERSKRNISSSLEDYRKSPYLSESWRSDLLSGYASSAKERQRKIEETETRSKIQEEMRRHRDEEIAKRVELQMRLAEREPMIIEDLAVEAEEEEEELPEISKDMDHMINKALRGQPAGEVLVEGYRLQITRGDIATLAGLNWLNDEVINFYMNMLMERGEKDNYPKCYAFNTFFYPKIMSGGHSTVRRWTKRVDIFSYDYIIIPVHLGMHWCLCIVDFKKKCVQYYDSMGGQNIKCLNAVKQYLCDECKDKKNQQFDVTGWSTEIMEDIPQQMNGSDCGMFACKFADYVTREANISFEQKHMPYFRRRMVYEIVTKKLLQ